MEGNCAAVEDRVQLSDCGGTVHLGEDLGVVVDKLYHLAAARSPATLAGEAVPSLVVAVAPRNSSRNHLNCLAEGIGFVGVAAPQPSFFCRLVSEIKVLVHGFWSSSRSS